MLRLICILLVVNCLSWMSADAQPNYCAIRVDGDFSIENGDRYFIGEIYLKPLGIWDQQALDEMIEMGDIDTYYYKFLIFQIIAEFDPTVFNPLPKNTDFSFIPAVANWEKKYENIIHDVMQYGDNVVMDITYSSPKHTVFTDAKLGLSPDNYTLFGTIKWKLLPTASGTLKLSFRNEEMDDKDGKGLVCDGIALDNGFLTVVFENSNVVEIPIPDDPLAGVDQPKDLAGLGYICGPEKVETYTVTRPETVDSCAWYLASDAEGKNKVAADGIADIAVGVKGENATITWKKTTDRKLYYLCVKSVKGSNESDPVTMAVNVEGFPEFTAPTANIICRQTELTWSTATGINTFLYLPDYSGGAKTSPYTALAENKGTYHFVRYRDGNADICADTIPYTPEMLDPVIDWFYPSGIPPATIDRGKELTAWWEVDESTVPFMKYTKKSIWVSPAGIAENVSTYRVAATAKSYDFEVYAEINGCKSNTLTAHTEVNGGGILPNASTVGGQDIACKDGGVMLICNPSGGTEPYDYSWYEKGKPETKWKDASVWVTPAATTKYYVEVTDANGDTGIDSVEITYKDVASVVVSAGADQAIVTGTYTYLCGSVVSAGASASYSWNWSPLDMLANGGEQSKQIAQTKNLTAGQKYAVYVVDGNGCVSKPDSVNVKVFQDITPPLSPDDLSENFEMTLSPAQVTLCKNNSVQLSLQTSGINLEGATYSWAPATGLSDATIPDPVLTVTDGMSSAEYMLTVEKGDFRITRKMSVTINSAEAPVLQLAEGRISCTGDVAEVTVVSGTANEYVWVKDGVATAESGNTYTFADAGKYHLKVYAKQTGSECASDTVRIDTTIGAGVQLAGVSADVVSCAADKELAFTSVTPAGTAFKWVAPDNSVVSTTDQTITANQTGEYMLIAGTGVCSDTARIQVKLNNVLAAEGLKPLITGCGNSAELAFTSTTATSFVWLDKDRKAIVASKDQNPYVVTEEGYYFLALDGGDCKDTLSVAVKLNYMPVVDVQPVQTTCGTELAINGTASAGTLYWSENADGSSHVTDKVTGNAETKTYYVYADAGAGCVSSKTEVKVSFNANPSVIADAYQTACESPYTLSASTTGTGGVKWYASETALNPVSPEVSVAGKISVDYWVAADDGDGCQSARQKVTVQFGVSPQLTVNNLQTTCEQELELQADVTGGKTVWTDMDGKELLLTTVQGNPNEVRSYQVRAVDGSCATGWEKVEVRFGAKPVVLAQTLQTVCGAEYTLVGSTSAGELNWYKNSGATEKLPSLTVQQEADKAVSSYYVQAVDGSCKSEVQEIRVAFNTAPVIEVVSPQTTCESNALTLSATTTGGNLIWKNSNGDKLPSVTVTQAGTYFVYAVDGSGASACQTAEKAVEVRFGKSPMVIADALQTSCGQTYTLSAQASGGELHWKENGVEVPAFIANEENSGERHYTVYAQDGSCVSSEENVTVKFNSYPEVTADANQITCEMTYQLQASATGGELIWKHGNTVLPTPQVSGTAGQTIQYTVQAKDNSCASAQKTVNVTFGSKPTLTVEPLQTACGESYTLQATASEGAQLHWQADAAQMEISADITGTKGETAVYWVWADKDGCSSDKQQVTVAFGEVPAVKADPITTCGLSVELQATVTGGSAVWTDNNGTVIADNMATGSYKGETKTYWVYAKDGNCQSAKQQVNVSFGVNPEVIVDKDITTCGEEYTLSATSTDKNAVIHWLNADKSQEVTVATGSTGSAGTYYVYAVTDATCKSEPVPVKVHFGAAPVLSVVSPQTVCDTIVTLQASASVNNLVWEDKNGKVLASGQVHGPAGSTAEYYVTAVDGACVSAKEAVRVEFGKKPEVIVQPVQTVCASATEYRLQAQATGGGLVWYESDNTTVLTNTIVPKVGPTAVYYVEAKDGECVSGKRTRVTVYFDKSPELMVDKVQTTCGSTITLSASATAGDVVWTNLNGDVLTLPQATDSKGQQQQFYAYAKDGDCESAKVLVDVKFGALPEVNVEKLQTACENTHLLTATASDGQIHWLAFVGATTDLPSLTVAKDQNPDNTYYVYAENGKDCASDKIPVTVLFGKSPLVSAVTPQTSCEGTIQLEASATGGTLVWTDEFGNKLTSTQVSNSGNAAEVNYYVSAVDGTCSSATQKVVTKFNSMPEVIADDVQTTCGSEYTIVATASEGVLHYFSGTTELPSAIVTSNGTYKVYAQGSSALCKSAEKEIQVTLGQKPVVTVNQFQSTCEDVLKLEASATGGEIFWMYDDKTTPLVLPQVTEDDGQSYCVYAANSREDQACRSTMIPVNVSFGAKPEVIVNTYQTSCSESYALQATASAGSTVHWLNGETDLGATPTVQGKLNTTAKYYVYATNGSCSSEKVEVTVAFGVAPEVTVAELQTTCKDPLTLTASTTAGVLHWRNSTGSKTEVGESWIVTGITNVPQKFYVYAQDGDCKTDEVEVTGNFGVSPAVLADTLQTTCESVYELAGLATEGELHWLYDSQELTTNKVSGLPNEVKEYYVYAQKGSDETCKSEKQQKVTVVFGATPQVTVQPVQTVCGVDGESTATIQLQASATGGKLEWTDSEGNKLVSATQTADKNTVKTYYVQAVDAACQSLKHQVEVKFGSTPVVDVEPLQTACGNALELQAQASAGSLVWQKGNTVLTNTTVNQGEGEQYKVYAKDGNCQSDPVAVDVLFNTAPAVAVVSPQTTCGNLIELQASATGGKIIWENAAHQEVNLTQIAGAAGEEATYYVYAKGDGCESAKEMVTVRFGAIPEILVEPVQTACGTEHVLTATATAGKVVWYAADGITPLASTTVNGDKGTTKEYYVGAEAGENCNSPLQKVTVHFGLPPTVTVDALQTTCESSLALTASATGGVLTWTDAAGVKLPTNQVSGNKGENAYYFVTATDGECSSTTERVEVRFGETPSVIAADVQTTCGTQYTLQATATDGKLIWYAANGTTKLPSTTVTQPVAGNTAEYYVEAANGSCAGEKQKITVAFGVDPVVTVLTPQTTCGTKITLQASATGGDLQWTAQDGTPLLSPVVEGNAGETAVYYVQAVGEGCQSLKEEVSVYFGQKPSVNVAEIQTACGSELNLKATASGGDVYWLKAGKTVLSSTQVKEAATYYVYAADNNCYSDTVAVEAKLGQAPLLSVVSPQTTCGTSLNLLASSSGGVIEWSRENGEKITPAFVEKQGKESEVFYVKAVDGSCSSAQEAVTVRYNTNPEVIAETLQTSCDTVLTLAGSVSAGNIVWMNSELTPLKSPVVHGQGTQTYYAKAHAGSCESPLLKVKVAFKTAPVVNVVTPQTACGTSLNLQASASAGELIWKEGNTVLTNTLVQMKGEATTATYTVQAKDGECLSMIKTVDVQFNESPSVIVQTEQITCGLEYKLQAQATGGVIHWVNEAMEEVPASIQGNAGETKNVWVYAQDGETCRSAVTKVSVKFGTAPKVPASVLAQQYTCSTPYQLPVNSEGGHLVWMKGGKELAETTVDLVEGDNVFYVYAEDDNCTPAQQTAMEKVIVSLSGKPELTLGNVHCVGDTLRAEEVMGTTGLTFRWTVNGTEDAAWTDNYYVFKQEGTYEVSVVAETSAGCASEPATASVNIAVPVKLDWDIKPLASVAYGANLNGCVKVISGSKDVKAYNWLSPEKAALTGKCFNIPAKEEEYVFKVYTTDQYGCVSDTLEATTTVTGFGTLDLTLNSESGTEICEGGSALLTAMVDGGKAPYTYEWYVKGAATPVRTQTTPSTVDIFAVAPDAGVTYVVKVKDAQSVPAIANAEIALTIKAGVALPIADAGPDMTIQRNLQTVLKGGASGVKEWSWLPVDKLNSAAEAGLQYPMTAKLATSQVYQLYVTDNNGCVSLPDEMVVYVLPLDGTEEGIPTPPSGADGLELVVKPSIDTICLGAESRISVKDLLGNLSAAATYDWTPQTGLTLNTKQDSVLFKPTAAGDYTFVVTVEDGVKKMALRSNIHVKNGYAPAFDLVVTGNCQNDTVKMVYADGSVSADKVGWKVKGTAVSCTDDYYVLSNTGNYTVEVNAENSGCASSAKSVAVTVGEAPKITAFVLADSCGQAVVEVTATGATAGYTWTATPEGKVDPDAATRYIVEGAGNFEVTVEASNGSCSDSRTLTGEIFSRPQLGDWVTEPMDASRSATITAGVVVQTGTGTPDYTYHWLQPDAAKTVTNGVYTLNPATLASYTFEVYASDAKGCVSDTLNKTIAISGGDVKVDIRSVYGNTVCQGGAAMLVAHVEGIEAPCVFEWMKTGQSGYVKAGISNALYDTVWVEASKIGEYKVNVKKTGTGNILCQGVMNSLTVDAAKQAPVVTTEPDLTIPSGGHTVLLAEVNNGTPDYNWHWSPANRLAVASDTAVQYPQTAALTEKQVFRVYVTDANSCVSVPARTTVSINENGLCVSIDPQDKEICRGNTVQMVANISCGKPTGYEPEYIWLPADKGSLLSAVNKDTVVFTPQQEGKYTWLVKVKNGGVVAVARTYVTVKDADAPVLTLKGDSDCVNDTLKVENSGEAAAKYVWMSDGLELAETGERLVLTDKNIQHVEVYAEAANACRSDLLSRDMKLGVVPVVEIAGGAFVNYRDSVNVIKVKQSEDLTAENYTFAWLCNPNGKINGVTDQLSVKTMPMTEDVKYTFTATSKDNAVCQATDTVWGYMIPQKAKVEINKDPATGNLLLAWNKAELGLADSVRIMNVKWDGYAVTTAYKPESMVKGDVEKYIVDTSKDTLEFFYINASRYIPELGKSYYALASDTVGYFKQWLYANANASNNFQFNYMAYPFDMSSYNIKTQSDLAKSIGYNSDGEYAVFTIAGYTGTKWTPLTILAGNDFDFSGTDKDLLPGSIYRIVLRKNEVLNVLLYGKLLDKFSYDLNAADAYNFILTPLSLGSGNHNRSDLGKLVEQVNTIGTYRFSEQIWRVTTRIPGNAGGEDDWSGTLGDYNIHLWQPVRIILMNTASSYKWKK